MISESGESFWPTIGSFAPGMFEVYPAAPIRRAHTPGPRVWIIACPSNRHETQAKGTGFAPKRGDGRTGAEKRTEELVPDHGLQAGSHERLRAPVQRHHGSRHAGLASERNGLPCGLDRERMQLLRLAPPGDGAAGGTHGSGDRGHSVRDGPEFHGARASRPALRP